MKIIFAVFSIVSLGIGAWYGQTAVSKETHTLHGTIKDPKGAAISGVALTTEAVKIYSARSISDINGDFSIELPPGDHVLVASSPTLYDFRAFIKITENGINPDNVEFVIDPDQKCCTNSKGEAFAKPTALPRPAYPAAARAVRAAGQVVVQLTINGEGKVLTAKAINGHPLLRAASEQAARRSLFEPSELPERELQLVYVFVPNAENLRLTTTRYTNPYRIEATWIAPIVSG